MREHSPIIIETIAKIRHEFTNYDKLSTFYAAQGWLRRKLNRAIGDLIDDIITIDEFRTKVKEIESLVDLTRKRNQKRFLRIRMDGMLKTGNYTQAQARAIAHKNLQLALQMQKNYNLGIYRYGIHKEFESRVSHKDF